MKNDNKNGLFSGFSGEIFKLSIVAITIATMIEIRNVIRAKRKQIEAETYSDDDEQPEEKKKRKRWLYRSKEGD